MMIEPAAGAGSGEGAGPGPSTPVSTPPPSKPWLRLIAFAIAGLLGVAAIGAAALVLLPKPGPDIERMVPADADVYAIAYLDPSVGQKLNLLQLAHLFPDLKTDADITRKVDEALDKALKDTGLTVGADVRPWVGAQLGLVVQATDNPPTAILITSRDDARAKAALAKLRLGEEGQKRNWRDETYRGVVISVGMLKSQSSEKLGNLEEELVYAYVDHTVAIANSEALMDELVDTDQGKKSRLVNSVDYKDTVSRLPADKLALVYVNGASVGDRLRQEIRKRAKGLTGQPRLDQLNAFQGVGFALVAKPNGLSGDLEVRFDPSKLDAQTRNALGTPPRKNAVLDWTPRRVYALLAITTLKQGLQQVIDQTAATSPELRANLDQFGVTGPTGVLAHLTGDAGLEFDHGTGKYPAGALLLGTDDSASMRRFLDKVATLSTLFAPAGPGPAALSFKKQTYHGVQISSLNLPALSEYGLAPAYAVTGGFGIIASSPDEIQVLIDTHASGQNIATAQTFGTVSKESLTNPESLLFVDISESAAAVRGLLPGKDRAEYDSRVAPNLGPLKAYIVSGQSASDRMTELFFVLIQ